jgi:hypothetical protein
MENFGLLGVEEQISGIKKDQYFKSSDMIKFNPKCFNCLGSTGRDKSAILELFKIACLNYQASPIKVQ